MTVKNNGRPRTPFSRKAGSPLAAFIDAKWEKVGMTNEEASIVFDVPPNMISNWKTGRSKVALHHLPKFADLLAVDEALLFVLWLKQERHWKDEIPASLVELLEKRIISGNEAQLIRAVRNATKNADPSFDLPTISAVANAVS